MKDIAGYEGLYGITSCGKVWSYRNKKFLKLDTNKHGYQRVVLSKNGKVEKFLVHRLVAEAYIPNPNNYDTVDHIDSNPSHNYIGNLQWMSLKDNIKKGNLGRKNAAKQIRCIETEKIFKSYTQAAKSVGVCPSAISNCIKGNSKTCGGYHWEVV